MAPRGLFNKDYRMDPEWRAIFGSSVDLTDCIVNIQEIFSQKMATDADDVAQPPDDAQQSISSECDVSSVDSFQTKFSSECDSGLDLDRCSVWRNSSSSTSTNSSSHQSSPSLVNDSVDGGRSTSFSNSSKVHFVIDEIVVTERNYVKDLQEICEGYIQPMRLSCFFTSEDIDHVFGNIEAIWQLHSAFFAALLPPDLAGPAFIAHTFLEFVDQFEIYTDYCTNYPSSLKHLAHLLSLHGQWFKDRQQELSHPLTLAMFLLKPIQRILKYHLLLQKLIDNCDVDVDGYGTMTQALETMKNMAQNINTFLQQRERKVRFEQLQLLLVDLPADLSLSDFGSLMLEDIFHVTTSRKERNLFLFEKGLLIVKPREDGTLVFKSYITHSNLMLSEVVPDNPLQFSVIPFDNPRLITAVESRNMEQKKIWTTKLKEQILLHYGANIPAHVRDLVMQLGTAAQINTTTISPRRFRPFDLLSGPSAPDYLRKRRAKSPVRANLLSNETKLSVVSEPNLAKSGMTKTSDIRKGRREDRRSTTKIISVTTDYIPTTKEDEIMFQERHSASQKSVDETNNRKGLVEISQETLSTSNPDKVSSRISPEASKKESRYKTLFGVGTKTFSKAYSQVVKPILKSIAGDQIFPVDKYPGSCDLLDGPELATNDGKVSHDETSSFLLANETDDEEVVSLSSEPPAVDVKFDELRLPEHPKLRRLTYDQSDSVSLEKNFCSSIKRKPVIKRSSKSTPGTPLIGEQEPTAPKPLSVHIQDRIRILEERARWTNDVFQSTDHERKPERPVLENASTNDASNDTWVSMMVKKIEAGAQS